MMSIKDSPIFKEDYAKLQKEIQEIVDEDTKKELTFMLLELSREVSALDMHHDAIMLSGKMPEAVQDSRSKVASIRKKIDAKLNLYKNTQKVKPEPHSNVG